MRRCWSTRRAAACSGSDPPHWPSYPAGAEYGRLYDRDRAAGLAAARLGGRLIASDLFALGIDVDCLPVADVPVAGADSVIGDRAYGDTPEQGRGDRRRRSRPASWRAACCRCSSTCPGTAARRRTATSGCPSSTADRAVLGGDRLRGVPAARRPAPGHDRPCCVHRLSTQSRRPRLRSQWCSK